MFCSFKYHFLLSFNSSSKTTPWAPAFTSTAADRPHQGRGHRSRPRGDVQRPDTDRSHTVTINIPGCGGSGSVKRLHLDTTTRGSAGAGGGLPEGASFSRCGRSKTWGRPPRSWERPPRSPQDGRRLRGEDKVACGEARGGHARLSGLQDDEGTGRGGRDE